MSESKTVSKLFMCIGIVFVACLLLSNLIAGKMWAVTSDITLPAAVILFPLTYIIGDVFTDLKRLGRSSGSDSAAAFLQF